MGGVRVFVSYRRADTAGFAGRLCDDLVDQFGADSVVRDVDSFAPGVDFLGVVDDLLQHCDFVLVVIGPQWLNATDARGRRRIDQPDDPVRLELLAALAGDVRVIPVLVQDAELPDKDALPAELQGLTRLNAIELSDHRWHHDVARLCSAMTAVASAADDTTGRQPARRFRRSWNVLGVGAAVLALAFLAAVIVTLAHKEHKGPWSKPANIDGKNTLRSASCADPTFCVAVDDQGNALSFNGARWSAPLNIDGRSRMRSVDCPTRLLCVAVDDHGNALTYDGKDWSLRPSVARDSLRSVSCPLPTFCAAVGTNGSAVAYRDGEWSAPTHVDAENILTAVACPTQSSCEAVDNDGNVLTSLGGAWSKPKKIDGRNTLTSIKCPTPTACIAADNNGSVLPENNGQWASAMKVDGTNDIRSIACPTSSFCIAVDDRGNTLTYEANTWSTPSNIDPGVTLRAVACGTSDLCIAVDDHGNVLTYHGTK